MDLHASRVTSVTLSIIEAWALYVFSQHLGIGSAVTLLTLANVFIFTIYRLVIYPRYVSPLRCLPGPSGGHILAGHLIKLYSVQPFGEIMRKWMEEIPHNGLIRFRDAFGKDAVLLSSPETIKVMLSDDWINYRRDPMTSAVFTKFIGPGLLTTTNQEHISQRRRMQLAFQIPLIRKMYPIFWDKATELADALRDVVSEREVNFSDWCSRVTLDLMGTAGFGQDFGSLKDPNVVYRTDFDELREPSKATKICLFLSLTLGPGLVFSLPFKAPQRLVQIASTMYQHAADLIKDRRAELAKAPNDQLKGRHDTLSHLMRSGDFDDAELSNQVRTMMMSGQITNTSALGWCAYLLSLHPEWQSELRKEIRSTTISSEDNDRGQGQRNDRIAQLDSLPLLNAVLSEVLRLYPVVTTLLRRSISDTHIDGWLIPAGTRVVTSPWAINRSTKIWGPDAISFCPQRWLDADGKFNQTGGAPHKYANLTFGHGPRNCIGQFLARSQLKLLLAAIVERYSIVATRDESTYYPAGVMSALSPAHGIWLKFSEV